MSRHVRLIRGTEVVVNCQPQASPQAEWLLSVLDGVDPLVHGTVVHFGWSTLTMRRDGDSLVVHEPDFDREPERDVRSDITCSLEVQGQMLNAARRAGIEPRFPKFSEVVAVESGCLDETKILLIRSAARFANDSGWLMFRGKEMRAEPDRIEIYRLLSLRPTLMQVLAFPNEWLVAFEGDEIVGVQPPNRRP
jgi:hypothetical protein